MDVMRLHTDGNGNVWLGQNGFRAVYTSMSAVEFVKSDVFRAARKVCLLGTPGNASLITAIHENRINDLAALGAQTVLHGPMLCHTEKLANDPVFALQSLWHSDAVSSIRGGCHVLDANDYTSFLLLRTLQESGGTVNSKAKAVVKYHPAWEAVSFVGGFDMKAATSMLCAIADPRWYNDVDRPGRSQKLLSHMGVRPCDIKTAMEPSGSGSSNARLVLMAWNGLNYRSTFDLDEPRNFLWRIFAGCDAAEKGLLKASRSFVQFVRLVWLQSLAIPGRRVFSPDQYFKQPCEVDAYKRHAAAILKA